MKTLRITLLPLLIASGLLFTGCATDIVGKAEQTTKITSISFDTFVVFERHNEAQLLAINPGIHSLAQKLRHKECATCTDEKGIQNGIRWLRTARRLTETYRLNRTPENKVNMQTAIAVIQGLLDEVTQYMLTPSVATLDPMAAAAYSKKTKVTP